MKIRRFFAKDMRTALAQVKEELGADAVIMSNKKVNGGVEIVAAIDSERTTSPPLAERQLKEDSVQLSNNASARDNASTLASPAMAAKPTPKSASLANLGNKFSNLLERYQYHTDAPATENDKEPSGSKNKPSTFSSAHLATTRPPLNSDLEPRRGAIPRAQLQREKSHALSQQYQKNRHDGLFNEPLNSDNALFNQHRAPHKNQSAMDSLHDEMMSIRKLLEHQLSGLMWQEVERRDPLRAMLIKRLEMMGLSNALSEQLAGYIPDDCSPAQAWKDVTELLGDQIITRNDNLLETGGVIALLGPTGVGKTTSIAKLAAQAAMNFGPEEVALVTTDTFRIGAHEQLATYGRILGCPVKVAKDADELNDVLYQFRHRRLVLLDTAGISQRDLRLHEQLNTLMSSANNQIKSLLVLSATAQRCVLQEALEHFRQVPLTGCVLTKLDEALSLGEALSITIENGLPIAYLANGQRVPEDIRQATGKYLVKKAIALMEQRTQPQSYFWDVEPLAPKVTDYHD